MAAYYALDGPMQEKCFKHCCIQLAHARTCAAFCYGPVRIYAFATEAGPTLLFPRHTALLHMGSTDYYDNVCYMGSLVYVYWVLNISGFICFECVILCGCVNLPGCHV